MLIRTPRGWELPERQATPEHLVFGRRAALGGTMALGAALVAPRAAAAQSAAAEFPAAVRNLRFSPGRDITGERDATTYNNYYEFGSDKGIHRAAQRLPTRPWTVKVDGLVDRPREYSVDDLLKAMPIEERVYRLRCVEAWSMVVPWTGFPISALLEAVGPQSSAKYLRFETAAMPSVMPGLRQSWYPWPYIEGCTIEEAANELSFLVVGAYGKPLLPQNGAPIRFHQPWKYGFKAGKSLVRISLVAERPKSFWEAIQASEYGFWANVNPEVAHPRWSQASERVLGTGERVPTQIFNGYGEFVAGLYTNLQRERLWA
ncbi:protein-methionine-sulfoxide reductase catalytic subunit MsrP [Siccirubricoccus deserti]|uniref:Protein-methionine-sulfoxide reductase catalytic subunit MsrP n=1 Tax=Siccirubricoccus deserti TaxID=2013562 RepID=A0A9X0QZU0_9PROT|nr:protein-methionine-sulfoxide reductase catalytic subunit MsrP [Siccirubricoccus deserti]MBC4016864.1 protein-methionine-sulfoxide reductase catalytic subunit MsrP [Siccirubricoccus deserti]GGC52575.1 protein-methionine-sulfoxide reductase catalytic subunit MsrP [Siccirubricoccus deserti]